MVVLNGGNENTYNPECSDFDIYLGCCSLKGNDLKACRKENCPKEV
ncbi:MAG: hypothetical protein PHH48_07805 [Eubacteriales bacterium]|nr:hypothetical protein [Eubacteriales bacterium]